jgi:hypothetical protein
MRYFGLGFSVSTIVVVGVFVLVAGTPRTALAEEADQGGGADSSLLEQMKGLKDKLTGIESRLKDMKSQLDGLERQLGGGGEAVAALAPAAVTTVEQAPETDPGDTTGAVDEGLPADFDLAAAEKEYERSIPRKKRSVPRCGECSAENRGGWTVSSIPSR